MTDRPENRNFTTGPILAPLLRFAFPVLLALVLQAMYGAVDLLVVGQFGTSADVSAVSTGSQLMTTVTGMIASFSMGTTILLGQQIGQGRGQEGGKTIGTSILLFFLVGCAVTLGVVLGAEVLANTLHAPAAAFEKTVNYIRICGGGALIIIFYNLIGSVFRGIGDSRTPLITVAIACVVNIVGDLLLCAIFKMGTEGAAIATVAAQAVSVVMSLLMIRKKSLSFTFSRKDIRFHRKLMRQIIVFGFPVALQDLLVGISFLVINAIVNGLGLIPSAGVGVAEKVCMFIMLVPSAFMQSLSAVVAQNFGAQKYDRAYKTLRIAITLSLIAGVIMGVFSFFRGDLLAGIFSKDPPVIEAAADYLKAYAIDCLLTAFLFCFVGFYNGIGRTKFVMLQGLCGAFLVRVPASFLLSKMQPVSLFRIGLATPCSTLVQILLCGGFLLCIRKRLKGSGFQEIA
ncbi:MAG: MATE family efflux transporter [Ruminococcaceae bacterium]|nr:MATE family efflux transporter [Oscillospiraceae bacterium]